MDQALRRPLSQGAENLARTLRRLDQAHPRRRLQDHRHRLQLLGQGLHSAWKQAQQPRHLQLQGLARALEGMSPLATLGRGYAILRHASDGSVLRRAGDAGVGEVVLARLADGELRVTVVAKD
jgi:exodeoxyribonuclease VII large subunit